MPIRIKPLIVTVALVLSVGCKSQVKPDLASMRAELSECHSNTALLRGQIATLKTQREQVEANKMSLPKGYDTTAIDSTLTQIDSELHMRNSSMMSMNTRCMQVEETIDRAEAPVVH